MSAGALIPGGVDGVAPEVLTDPVAPRLVVKDLEIRLTSDDAEVVSDVSFTVRASEVLGVVGESGSGKTTVALALLGYARRGLRISSGEILLDGADLLSMRPPELRELRGRKVSYVPQDPAAALNPTLKIGTQLTEVLKSHPGAVVDVDARIVEVLKEARLDAHPEMLRRYPHQLSGGQQQRFAIAMAFACRPSLIVLDEPTTGLDVSSQRHILETVRRLCASYGVAAVYVSHDLAVVGGLVSQVAVMYAGRIIELGETRQVFNAPVHPYTRGLLAAAPSPERAEVLTGIDGQPPRPGRRPNGCSFAPRCSYAVERCRTEVPLPVLVEGALVRCLRATEIHYAAREHVSVRALAPSASNPTLSLRGLSASYGGTRVLYGIDLDLPPERCVAVVGESGSGKTTLARCIVGLHSNWTGEMQFCREPLAPGTRKRTKDVLRRVQYIFQNPYTSLNPRKTVGQILSQPLDHFFRLGSRENAVRIRRVLESVSLGEDFEGRYPDQLSGGERQRVAIARALIVEPDVLVCDEVTSALDVSVQAVIVELLRQLQRDRHLSMIFITHNLALVRSIAQSAIVLCEGHVVESGAVEQILEHPNDPYTIRLMEDVPRLANA
ncbi:MAG TPA: ABC transporter ATP-binding protein [Acidimicrobiales bacterium]|nr:ABC transporter ATP-binding protein [Acidimicrobiales bacterium]